MIEWITDPVNLALVLAAAVALVNIAERLARLTPTKSDDKWVARLYKLLAVLGAKVADNPGKPDDPDE